MADILVIERRREDPWENVVEADPSWVELVTIEKGNPVYGRADLMKRRSTTPSGRKRCSPGKSHAARHQLLGQEV